MVKKRIVAVVLALALALGQAQMVYALDLPIASAPKKGTPLKSSSQQEKPPIAQGPFSQQALDEAAAQASAGTSTVATSPSTSKDKPSVTGSNFQSGMEEQVLKLQNEERARLGLKPLVYDAELQSAARIRSKELYTSATFRHQRPNGKGWETVLQKEIPYDYAVAGENLCMTVSDFRDKRSRVNAQFWVTQWINSEPHYKNMIREEYTRAGVGIYMEKQDDITYYYAATLFALPKSEVQVDQTDGQSSANSSTQSAK